MSRTVGGFDLHAGVRVPAGQRDRLERVCRYALRSPLSDERLAVDAQGQVVLQMRRPWAGGTTALVFDPLAFLERAVAGNSTGTCDVSDSSAVNLVDDHSQHRPVSTAAETVRVS